MTSAPDTGTGVPTRLVAVTLTLTLASFCWVVWTASVQRQDMDVAVHNSQIGQLNGVVMRLDEVLTMSARMAAATGESRWEQRYRQHEPELDAAIKDTLALATEVSASTAVEETDAANAKLVAMENQAFALVRGGRNEEARALLFSPAYEEQKTIYATGMSELLASVKTQIDRTTRRRSQRATLLIAGSIVLFGLSMWAWGTVLARLRRTQHLLASQVDSRTAALQVSEEGYRSLFEHMMEGGAYCRMVYEDDGRPQDFIYLAVNHAFGVQTGLKNVVGRKASEVIPGLRESNPELFEAYGRVASTGTPERLEVHVPSLDMWLSIAVYSSQKDCFVAVFDVITARKQADAALQASESMMKAITETASDAILAMNDQGAIVFWNPAAEEMFGYSATEACGRMLHVLLAPARYHGSFGAAFPTWLETGQGGAIGRTVELTALRKGGAEFDIELSLSTAAIGARRMAIGTIGDITERKRISRALQESEDRFRHTSLSMTDVAYSCVRRPDGDLVIDWVTGATEAFSGYSNEEFQALGCWASLVLEEDRALFEEQREGARPWRLGRCSLRLRKKDGDVVWVASYCRCVASKDEPGQVRLYGGLRGSPRARRRRPRTRSPRCDSGRCMNRPATPSCFWTRTGSSTATKRRTHVRQPRQTDLLFEGPGGLLARLQPCGTDSMTLASQRIATAMKEGTNRFEWVHKRLDTGENFPAEVLLSR